MESPRNHPRWADDSCCTSSAVGACVRSRRRARFLLGTRREDELECPLAPKPGRLYLPTAQAKPVPDPGQRRTLVPDTFAVMVLAPN
jgi:hypothetical protein